MLVHLAPHIFIYCNNAIFYFSEDQQQLCIIDCHDQFYCEDNICKPRCNNFRDHSYEYTVASDVLVAIGFSIGILCGIAILMITCLRYKRM